MRLVTNDSNPEDVVRNARETGVTGLKFYSGLEQPLIGKLTEEAHKQGLKVWSHAVVWPTKPSGVSQSGVDVLSHAHGLYAEFPTTIPDDIGVAIRQWLPQQDFSEVDLNEEPYTSLFTQIKKNNQILEPTLYALDKRRGMRPPPPKVGQKNSVDFDAFIQFACDATRSAIRHGIPIAAGTDTFGNTLVAEEMLLLTNCGASPLDAITAATYTNARALGINEHVGTLQLGKIADFLVLNSDPLSNLNNLNDIEFVVKNGTIVEESLKSDEKKIQAE